MDNAQRGAKALSASDFPTAIQEYTHALIINPHAPDYYLKRSTAFGRIKPADGGPDFNAALHDAEMAIALGIQRARREQIIAGQMRRGIVLFQLGRFADAQFIFDLVRNKLGPPPSQNAQDVVAGRGAMADKQGNSSISQELQIWDIKVKNKLGKAVEAGEESSTKVTVTEIPDVKVLDQAALKKIYQAQLQTLIASGSRLGSGDASQATVADSTKPSDAEMADKSSITDTRKSSEPDTASKLAPQPASIPGKVRHEWYQSSDTVTLTLYAKGVPKDQVDIEINEQSLSISFPTATGSDFSFNLDPLYAPIDVSNSRSSVLSTKIEVLLRKKQGGQKWAALEGTALPEPSTATQSATPIIPTLPAATSKAPAYPTSSRKGVKDWDKLAAELTKKKKTKKKTEGGEDGADEGGEEGGDGDIDDELADYGGDPVDAFFKKLYADADPDTRRAMMKSYVESQGTALSTNWAQVGKGKVEPHPPSED